MENSSHTEISRVLLAGGIVVIRTDTIYGIVAQASSEQAVARVYAAKQRDPSKQCILLATATTLPEKHRDLIVSTSERYSEPVSIIVPATDEPAWLRRGGNGIAYRLVKNSLLQSVIDDTGPLIAPSANPEGEPPARTIDEARSYFGDKVHLYVDGGEVPDTIQPSRLIQLNEDGTITTLR